MGVCDNCAIAKGVAPYHPVALAKADVCAAVNGRKHTIARRRACGQNLSSPREVAAEAGAEI